MAYSITITKEESLVQLKVLITAFEKEHAVLKNSSYKETSLRIDFINPLLKTFGWDVDNESARTQFLREVVQEETIDVEEDDTLAKKNPDYTLRIQGTRKLFIEAKKVSIDIEKSSKSAFQTRRYGWNANLGISILTNFEKLIIYDCRHKPLVTDDANVARYQTFYYSEFEKQFDTLYKLLSYNSVASGFIDDYFSLTQNDLSTFDDYFLRQIENWRHQLATEIIFNNSGLNDEDINYLIQRLLNRIVFLRICEDREIEKFENLKSIKNYDELKALFIKSDKKYNSGLFEFIEDNFTLKINLKSEILINIFNELYYPESPFDFSVVDPSILSQIYERYLGSKIAIVNSSQITIVEEPEVAVSSGVVPTPKLIVENIVKETLDEVFINKSHEDILKYKIADICCGSGTFLISVYDFLIEKLTIAFINKGINDDELIYKSYNESYILTLKAKQALLVNCIYGVDINPYAIEVTKFSLLLKLLENENASSIDNYLVKYKQKVLPSLEENIKSGNSLVDNKYFDFNPEAIEDDALLYKVKPFTWHNEFPFLTKTLGFDAIVGNPPYIRIQNMVKYQAEEIKYYQSTISKFTVAETETFDKYYLFIQRAIDLLNPEGILGYIVPNKFFIVKGGKALREFISTKSSIRKIIHFGVSQVFPGRSTYTAILILDKKNREQFNFKRIKKISSEFISDKINYVEYKNAAFTDLPWIFISKESEAIFEKIKGANTLPLKQIAEITVGLQTSADKIYIFQPHAETDSTFKFLYGKAEFEIEKGICKPCIYDLSFNLFDTILPNAQIIFPYIINTDKAELFSEDYFKDNYPLAWIYLNTCKDSLSKRSINGSKDPKWYQYGRSQSLTKFHNTAKLIWPVLSTSPSYIYDSSNLQFTGGGNGPYYSLICNSKYSPLYILGILSHPLFEKMVKSGASEFRGDYYSHGKQFIENLPIHQVDFADTLQAQKHNEIVKIVSQLISTKHQYSQTYIGAKKRVLERKMEYLFEKLLVSINQIYGITIEEMNKVMNDETFLTDLNEN